MAETCLYAGVTYSPGALLCQAGRKKLCDSNGQWSDLGTCDAVEGMDIPAGQFRIEFPGELVSSLTDADVRKFVEGQLLDSIVAGMGAARETAAKAATFETSNRVLASDGQAPKQSPGGGGGASGSGSTTVNVGVEFPVGNGGTVSIQAQGQSTGGGGVNSSVSVLIRFHPK